MKEDINDIKNRIKKRNNKPLNDRNFKLVYNIMIKLMVIMLVVISSLCYVKFEPTIADDILNNKVLTSTVTWVSKVILDYLPEESISVSSDSGYNLIKDDYFANDSNQVTNIYKGKVVSVTKTSVKVLTTKNRYVLYEKMKTVNIKNLDSVKKGTILGTYDKKVKITFYHFNNKITYDEYKNI